MTTPGPALGLSGSAGLSSGNVASAWWAGEVSAQILTLYDTPAGPPPWFRDRAFVHATVRRASYDGEVQESEGLLHARYTRMWVPRAGTEVFAQLQYDRFLLLERRTLGGAGIRLDAIHQPNVGLWGGTGAMLEHERLSDGTESSVVRSTSYLSGGVALVPKRLAWKGTAYLQPRVDLPADYRFLAETSVEAEVTGVLSFGTELVVRHDSRPPDGVLPTDLRLGTTIKLRLARRAVSAAAEEEG